MKLETYLNQRKLELEVFDNDYRSAAAHDPDYPLEMPLEEWREQEQLWVDTL